MLTFFFYYQANTNLKALALHGTDQHQTNAHKTNKKTQDDEQEQKQITKKLFKKKIHKRGSRSCPTTYKKQKNKKRTIYLYFLPIESVSFKLNAKKVLEKELEEEIKYRVNIKGIPIIIWYMII